MHVRTRCLASIARGCRKNKMTDDLGDVITLGGADRQILIHGSLKMMWRI